MEIYSAGGGSNWLAVTGSCPASASTNAGHPQSRIAVQRTNHSLTTTFLHFCSLTTSPHSVPRYSRWESSANSYSDSDEVDDDASKVRRRRKRRWWSDYKPLSMEPEDEGITEILEKTLSSFWIFKVCKSFGWALPPILLSWLFAGGPKAFLMAFTLCLGFSVLVFTFDKLAELINQPESVMGKMSLKRSAMSSGRDPLQDIGTQAQQKNKEEEANWAEEGTSSFGGWDTLDKMESQLAFDYYSGGNFPTKIAVRQDKEPLPIISNLPEFRFMKL